ncbi:uncharacterized protein LOC115984875 [Quercus lobata]|uniref:uncharacterized protein LOC115984875 n=1 Tax=Quercus lobata TaxID=97700 RepID=UPI001246D012|nr:uncharacterized protein LOC115984875 [Quercus lobata]
MGKIKEDLGKTNNRRNTEVPEKSLWERNKQCPSQFPPMKMPKNDKLDIFFSEREGRNIRQSHDDPLVIMLRLEEFSIHQFPTTHGVEKIRGDQVLAKECYQVALESGKNHTWVINEPEPIPELSKKPQEVEIVLRDLKKEDHTSSSQCQPIMQTCVAEAKNIAPKGNKAITKEVEKLLEANFIREVFYPSWLVNVVMVKKSNGKRRTCVNFIDLNKACLKDSFPLLRIDQLVDSTTGHKLLSFMDTFYGYNQIIMDENDQEKTLVVTSQGLYCYKVMPFGLKNAGATYQRLVYVDDMLVKREDGANTWTISKKPSAHYANPYKVKAIIKVKSPKTMKEVQSLTGKVAALNRFVSRVTDKCMPFFKVLKKGFQWNDKCKEALAKLKEYLTKPPLLNPLVMGEKLLLYLAVSNTIVSSALIKEEGNIQKPVYYTSQAFQGA